MRLLHKLQIAFADALLSNTSTACEPYIHSKKFSVAQHLQIYRNNFYSSLTAALQAVYPVVERLVGKDFFRFAARKYIHDYPSWSGNLHDYGDKFADFLSEFNGARELTYLPDVARLEWAYHKVFHAPQSCVLTAQDLENMHSSQWPNLVFHLNSASKLVKSDFPILHIWQVNQESYSGDQTINLDEGGQQILVIRSGEVVKLYELADSEYQWLVALQNKNSLGVALDAVLKNFEDFHFSEMLSRHMQIGTFTTCEVD